MSLSSGAVQAGKFGIVGILNTLLDFVIFNLLTSRFFRVPKVAANIFSTTVAMTFSFFANRQAVFTAGTGDPVTQAVLFFAVTGFGLWVLQTGILHLVVDKWRWPRALTAWALRITSLGRLISTEFALKNGGKAFATLFSLAWNFVMYKYLVFR